MMQSIRSGSLLNGAPHTFVLKSLWLVTFADTQVSTGIPCLLLQTKASYLTLNTMAMTVVLSQQAGWQGNEYY